MLIEKENEMRVFRAINTIAVDYMKDKLIASEFFTQDDTAEILKTWLREKPEEVYLLQAWDKDEDGGDVLAAFVAALAPENQRHIILIQAWIDSRVSSGDLQDSLFLHVCLWAESKGRVRISAETYRNPLALLRRWNFVEQSVLMSFDIVEGLSQKVTISHDELIGKKDCSDSEQSTEPRLEKEDGTRGRDSGDNLKSDEISKESSKEDRSVSGEGSGGGAGEVSGTASAGVKPSPGGSPKPSDETKV